jgi:hypothetical protein
VWVAADGSRTLTALDPRDGSVLQVAAPNAFPSALALGAGALWLADRGTGSVVAIDPSYAVASARIRLPGAARMGAVGDRGGFDPWSIAAGAGAVWVTDGSRRLFEIDPGRRRVARTLDLGHVLDGVAVGDGRVWAISGHAALALRIDPRTGRVRDRIEIVSRPGFRSPYPIALGIEAGSVWVLKREHGDRDADRPGPARHQRDDPARRPARPAPACGRARGGLRGRWGRHADPDRRAHERAHHDPAGALSALPPAGRRFVARLRRSLGQDPSPSAVYAAQAADILLNAIARSDGTRGSVSRELLRTRVRGGILGDFAITRRGETTAGAVTVYRVEHGKQRLFAVVTPPASLVAGT